MAGSGKKKQNLSSDKSISGGTAPLVIQAPDVSHFVLPGDPPGLIHKTKLATDQTVTIATWDADNPTTETEYFRLLRARRGSDEWELFQEHPVVGPTYSVSWVPLTFTISKDWLNGDNEGLWDIIFEHVNYIPITDRSPRVPLEIDRLAPNGNVAPEAITLAVTGPITDAAFAANDYIVGTLPTLTGSLVDVLLYFTWHKGQLPDKPEDMQLVPAGPAVSGGTVNITKDMVVGQGDGACTAGFVLVDKAGNAIISKWDLRSVALGPLPIPPLTKPTLKDATGGELLRSDIVGGGAMVNIPHLTNGKATDTVVVQFKDQKLEPGTPVGGNPAGGIDIFLPWKNIWEAYASYAQAGVVEIDLAYDLVRGIEPYASAIEKVKCNLSAPGPVVGLPNPEPGNSLLKKVTIVGKSGVDNVLIAADEDQEVTASIELVGPLVVGDSYQIIWGKLPIGDPYPITATDSAGDIIEIVLDDWDTIREAGPSSKMEVWYELTNDDHENPQEPDPRTEVDIGFLVITLPEAVPQHLSSNGFVNCGSLRWNEAGTSYGIQYLIPPNAHMKKGDEVTATWKAFTDFFGTPTEVVSAKQEFVFTDITQQQADTGIMLLVEPYATKVLPTWSKTLPIGKGEVAYAITGKPAASKPTNTKVSMSEGEGSCTIPPPPNP